MKNKAATDTIDNSEATAEINRLLNDLKPYSFTFSRFAKASAGVIAVKLNSGRTKLVIAILNKKDIEIENDGKLIKESIYTSIRTSLQNSRSIVEADIKEASQQIIAYLIKTQQLEDREGFLGAFRQFIDRLPKVSPELEGYIYQLKTLDIEDLDIDDIDEKDPRLVKLTELHSAMLKSLDLYKGNAEQYIKKITESKAEDAKSSGPIEKDADLLKDADILNVAGLEFKDKYPKQNEKLERVFEILNSFAMEQKPDELEKVAKILGIAGDKLKVYFQARSKSESLEQSISSSMLQNDYWYSDDDMDRLGKRLEHYGVNVEQEFKGRLTKDVIEFFCKDQVLEESKPIFISYNIAGKANTNSGIHWVGICVVRYEGKIKVLYKDPKGNFGGNAEIVESEFKRHYGNELDFIRHIGKEQKDDSSCGPMTINNLEIMAKKVKEDGLSALIKDFRTISFTTQNIVYELRAKHFTGSKGLTSAKNNKNDLDKDIEDLSEIRDLSQVVKDLKLIHDSGSKGSTYNPEEIKRDVEKINEHYEKVKSWEREKIISWAKESKGKLSKDNLDTICETIAVMERANELATLDASGKGHRLRDTQKVAILIFILTMDKGHISQINTGEGKTTIVSFVQALKVFQGYKAHIITSNPVLAEDGVKDKKLFYGLLEISVAHNNPDQDYKDGPRACYAADIVYGSINNFQFDWLRHSFERQNTLGDTKFEDTWVMLDEIDSLLIDQGGNIAKLSGPFPGMESLRYIYINMWAELIKAENEVQKEILDKLEKKAEELHKKEQSFEEKLREKYTEKLRDVKVDLQPSKMLLEEEERVVVNHEEHVFTEKLKLLNDDSVFTDLMELERLKESNQVEYEKYEDELREKFLEEIKSKIRAKKDSLINKKIIAKHLHKYAEQSIDRWIEGAFAAKFVYAEDVEYKIAEKDGERVIIPVDNANTGVSMQNTILSNGLHQFLQVKHNLCLTYESLTSSYVSNLGYITKYGSKLSGATGTLGSDPERELLGSVFNLEFSIIPTYKPKLFEQFPGTVLEDDVFVNGVAIGALGELIRKDDDGEVRPRAVLIVCSSRRDAKSVAEEISKEALGAGVKPNIKIYTDESEAHVTEETLNINDIVIATNIAGRGTDFKTSQELEDNIGLHVIEAFLPCNKRVEDQGQGRTSRQGNHGTGQIIVKMSELEELGIKFDPKNIDFKDIIRQRDELEAARVADIKANKITELKFKDRLFDEFSALYGRLKDEHKKAEDARWVYVLNDLKEKWAFWLEEQDYTVEKVIKLGGESQAVNEFGRFNTAVNEIIFGKIMHNPFYSICLADNYLQAGGKENRDKSRAELGNALKVGDNSELLYSAYVKLFEIEIEDGGQVLERYKKAVAKIFFISVDKDEDYKRKALEQLKKAKSALEIEQKYLDQLFESNEFNSVLIEINPSGNGEQKGDANIFTKHLGSRYTCLSTYSGNINSLIVQMGGELPGEESLKEGVTPLKEGIIIGTKASRYLSKLDPKLDHEKKLKEAITDREVDELEYVGMNSVIQVQEIHDVPDEVITNAQWQIGAGLAALAVTIPFPFLLPINGPIAGALISEGITDIIMALIDQGQSGFDKGEYVKGKLISYGISIVTMGIGAIASSTKILTKAMNVCKNLATKLRAVKGPFAKVCGWMANKLDKLAKYFERAIEKIEFARKTCAQQVDKLTELHKAEKLADFQKLQKLQKVSDVVATHSQKLTRIVTTSVTGALKGVAVSVCMEKIFIATLDKIMAGLKPVVEKEVKAVITRRINAETGKLSKYPQDTINQGLQTLFVTSLGEDIEHVAREIGLGMLRHCNNWKAQLATLAVESMISGVEIATYTNKICDKFFGELSKLPSSNTNYEHNYDNIIEQISTPTAGLLYSKIVSITGKVAITLPKVVYRGYKQHQEKKADQKAIAQMKEKIEGIKAADKTAACAHEAVSETLGVDNEHLSHSSGLATSKSGASAEDTKRLYRENGIATVECDVGNAVTKLNEAKSDRAVVCLSSKDGGVGHAVPVTLEGGKLMVQERGSKIPLTEYQAKHSYTNAKIIVPEGVNANTLPGIKHQTNKHRIGKATHKIDFVGKDNTQKFGAPKPGTKGQLNKAEQIRKANEEKIQEERNNLLKSTGAEAQSFEIDKNAVPSTNVQSQIQESLKTIQSSGNLPTNSNQNFADGFRLEPGIGKSSYEIQKNGMQGQTTVAVVHYPPNLFQMLPEDKHIEAKKIIAQNLALSFRSFHTQGSGKQEKYYSNRITLGGDVFKHLFLNKQNKGDITQIHLRETSIDYWLEYEERALVELLVLRLDSIPKNIQAPHNLRILGVEVLDISQYVSFHKQLTVVSQKIQHIYTNVQSILLPVLIPESALVYHWIGMVLEKRDKDLIISYLDSENRPVTNILKDSLVQGLEQFLPKLGIIFSQTPLEQQRYNNCGPELIENFIYYLTGNRATQEAAVYVHSLLLENTLLDKEKYKLKISENDRIIDFLSNQAPLMIDRSLESSSIGRRVQLAKAVQLDSAVSTLVTYLSERQQFEDQGLKTIILSNLRDLKVIEASQHEEENRSDVSSQVQGQDIAPNLLLVQSSSSEVSPTALIELESRDSSAVLAYEDNLGFDKKPTTRSSVNPSHTLNPELNLFLGFIKKLANTLDISWQCKKVLYRADVKHFNEIVVTYDLKASDGSQVSISIMKNPSEFKKSVLLKIHPDKGGYQEDFVFIKNLEEKFSQNINIKKWVDNQLTSIQPIIYKANIGFKVVDTVIDSARAIYTPTFDNSKKVVMDTAYLYSMYYGVNSYAVIVSGAEIMYQTYLGEYSQALQQGAITISYMALPWMISIIGMPYLSFVYSASMAAYSGYNTINNGYSLYLELSSTESKLATVYKDFMEALVSSPLQRLYDFAKIAEEYEIAMSNVAVMKEKAAIKIQLEREKEQKLSLENRYSLLNQVLKEKITQEETELLKVQHIAVALGNQVYTRCMEIRDSCSNNATQGREVQSKHYYCYNTNEEILNPTMIGNSNIEFIEYLF